MFKNFLGSLPFLKRCFSKKILYSPCKCCLKNTAIYIGDVPFETATEINSFSYYRCQFCGFIQSTALDCWSYDELKKYIYNENYHLIDTGYIRRSETIGCIIAALFDSAKKELSILDYGAGEEKLIEKFVQARGFICDSFDPFYLNEINHDENKKYNLITLFEVMEHHTNPHQLIDDLKQKLATHGMIFFSTEIIPQNFEDFILNWWYVSPKSGHISIYSENALKILFNNANLSYQYLGKGLHLAWQGEPPFGTLLSECIKGNPRCSYNRIIDFNDPLYYFLHTGLGWGDREDWGIWSTDTIARLRFKLPEKSNTDIHFVMNGHVYSNEKHVMNKIKIYINGSHLKTWKFKNRDHGDKLTCTIPKRFSEKTMDLKLVIDKPASPMNLGLAPDSRMLGLGLKSCEFRNCLK